MWAMLNTELQDSLDRDPGHAAQVQRHDLPAEAVDARRHGRVRGEHRAGAHGLQGLVEGQPRALDELADPLDTEESRMALVHVVDLRRRRSRRVAVRPQRSHATDAEQQLLFQTVLGVAPVEPIGDLAGSGVVFLDVAVEQQQWHPAHLRHPYLRLQRSVVRQRQRNTHRAVVRAL
jgi:hypothetical protein